LTTTFNPKRIFLLGFMGSGKSYIGKKLSERMSMPFSDLDDIIEKGEDTKISAIFETSGEKQFRLLEKKYLHTYAMIDHALIATGGGTPCFFDNMEWMNKHGVTIYLKASSKLLAQRLLAERSHRPLLSNLNDQSLLDFIRIKLEERASYYEQASVIVEQTKNDETIIEELYQNFSSITGH
jgi:shikimate kinase